MIISLFTKRLIPESPSQCSWGYTLPEWHVCLRIKLPPQCRWFQGSEDVRQQGLFVSFMMAFCRKQRKPVFYKSQVERKKDSSLTRKPCSHGGRLRRKKMMDPIQPLPPVTSPLTGSLSVFELGFYMRQRYLHGFNTIPLNEAYHRQGQLWLCLWYSSESLLLKRKADLWIMSCVLMIERQTANSKTHCSWVTKQTFISSDIIMV